MILHNAYNSIPCGKTTGNHVELEESIQRISTARGTNISEIRIAQSWSTFDPP